ncbi:hypothetical protein HME9302_02138 [Alteripontixanthobacter maritimus]|uniref:Uncharacterized protein n=1 Tax=Alteripontixanthobacter maritimus TaxID=2161824 RepID=A0A369Q7R6_9SPHN|nr:hypothetical protein [Alteripontixanthobacter maritimus]RDC60921.1 hypothetical protein HME9302_02138 [Alteripontixanthobacter maritimus]
MTRFTEHSLAALAAIALCVASMMPLLTVPASDTTTQVHSSVTTTLA